jgi:replication factor A2
MAWDINQEYVNWTHNYCSSGTYVRIVGAVKNFNQKQYVQVHSIRPIASMNEVTYHNLEVLYVHVNATRNKVT